MSGYFGVAVWIYGAAMLATVGRRYQEQASDTVKAPNRIPLQHYTDIDDLVEHLPHGCPLVGIELDARARPLTGFRHPRAALYLLGAEDHGLTAEVLDRCHHIVQIPTPARFSMNVATAGTLVLHDRFVKSGAAGPRDG